MSRAKIPLDSCIRRATAHILHLTLSLLAVLGPHLGAEAATVTGNPSTGGGVYQTDGTVRQNLTLVGAWQTIVSNELPTNTGEDGDDVVLTFGLDSSTATNAFDVWVGNEGQLGIDVYSNGGAANPWASGILAYTSGANGAFIGNNGKSDSIVDAGNGGSITLTVGQSGNTASQNAFVLNYLAPPAVTGSLTLSAVTALSQGGVNSARYTNPLFGSDNFYYSNSGDGGAVSVDFLGSVVGSNNGVGYGSSAGLLIEQQIGITAISRGGVFECYYDNCNQNFIKGDFQTPGAGGDVTVNLLSGSDIDLTYGSAFGIYAASVNGAIIQDAGIDGFAVDSGGVVAGTVDVTVESGASIAVGSATEGGAYTPALEAFGILALSAGSELTVPLAYQTGDLVAVGGAAIGSNVTVNNAGTISATGALAVGVSALSLGGQAAVGLLGTTGAGTYVPNKHAPAPSAQLLGTVDVVNSGDIVVEGDTAFGIIAASQGRGGVVRVEADWLQNDLLPPDGDFDNDGIINQDDPDTDNDGILNYADTDDNNNGIPDYPCVNSGSATTLPDCDGTTTGVALGNSDSDSEASGNSVSVSNSGSIRVGRPSGDAINAVGIFAQSLGGGGGAASGGVPFTHGDTGGDGGNGGNITFSNSGDIGTFGSFSQGLHAQTVGGGGGAGASSTGLFVSVGGSGGKGGNGGTIDATLSGAGTIVTEGAFSQGFVAHSIGGGGGAGGSANGYGIGISVAVGGAGGDGGEGGSIQVSGVNNNDPVNVDPSAGFAGVQQRLGDFDIVTAGGHATGILTQSIGGGGGVGGNASSKSISAVASINVGVGGAGGGGGNGSTIDVESVLDIISYGADAYGISAQSIGGGGGVGGTATVNDQSLAVPTDGLPNVNIAMGFGGSGGTAGDGGVVIVDNAGVIATGGSSAVGILGQSIGGGGGSGGDANTISRSIPLAGKSGGAGSTFGINFTGAFGGNGGGGGSGGQVDVFNGVTLGSGAAIPGTIITEGSHSTGIVAQSVGGGGGTGGEGDAKHKTAGLLAMANSFKSVPEGTEPKGKYLAFSLTTAVGGSGGTGGDGNTAFVFNGQYDYTGNPNAAGTIITRGGASPGIVAQSLGGGGGLANNGSVNGAGGTLNMNMGFGGDGGLAGNGGSVLVENPVGAVIRTGEVRVEAVSEADVAEGLSPYLMVTRGGSSVGILAQSIGGGGGSGGSADAAAAVSDDWQGDVKVFTKYVKTIKSFSKKEFFEPEGNINLSFGGGGGAAGVGGEVEVYNAGLIETFGQSAHGIHGQSIGGGGGAGGAVEAESANWQTFVSAPTEYSSLTLGLSFGGTGGAGGDGGIVKVGHNAGGFINTHGYGSHAIFAQSIGGGGGYGAQATANAEGFFYLGFSENGDGGSGGRGGAITVDSQGYVQTWGDEAIGVFAHSVGGGGGSAAAGCTNSVVSFGSVLTGQSPCWGNYESEDGITSSEPDRGAWGSMSITLGGNPGTSDTGEDGGAVSVTIGNNDSSVTTRGSRSMGVVAQSIGGGGGYFSAPAEALKLTVLAPSAGANHSAGGTVDVVIQGSSVLNDAGSILTEGRGSWGILAQSLGGGGGFNGDPSLNLGLIASNTLPNQCCGQYSTGADGGEVNITLQQNSSVITQGVNAHGIVAQSIGGGGGIAAGYDQSVDSLVYMGNPRSAEWGEGGLPALEWSGQGGEINIDIEQDASVAVYGQGSIGIIAQSSGNESYQSPITINVSGSVYAANNNSSTGNTSGNANIGCDGCVDPSAILISGGTSGAPGGNQHGYADNAVNVNAGGQVEVADLSFSAITSVYGKTNVTNYGTITGGIVLGLSDTDPNLGDVTNYGTWTAGNYNLVANNSAHNFGLLIIPEPTTIAGSLKQDPGGELRITLDPDANLAAPVLTVTNDANIEGRITFRAERLLPGEYSVLQAGTLNLLADINPGVGFNLASNVTAGGAVSVTPSSNFSAAATTLGSAQGSLAAYLDRGWARSDTGLASAFGALLGAETVAAYNEILNALSSPGLLQNNRVVQDMLPSLLGDTLDCPLSGGGNVLRSEGDCFWLNIGFTWSDYTGDDGPSAETGGSVFSIGAQREFAPGWFASASFGHLDSNIEQGAFRSDGDTEMLSLGLKREAGPWSLGLSTAYASGDFDNQRSLPFTDTPTVMESGSDVDVLAGRGRASYQFDFGQWYLRPALDLDLVYTKTGDVRETVSGNFALDALGESSTDVYVEPHVEVGGRVKWGTASARAYLDTGVRLAPGDDFSYDARFQTSTNSNDTFEISRKKPLATAMVTAGTQLEITDRLDFRFEYNLQANESYRWQSASGRLNWQFEGL